MIAYSEDDGFFEIENKINVRDYFAAKAMTAILAEEMRTYKALEFTDNGEEIPSTDLKWIAHRAYYMADAMMESRAIK
jgi:hypothetical protein